MSTGRKILLGVTGSIAAYKSAWTARELMRRGHEVRVVMTASATEFITPLTLATLTGHRVYSDFTEDSDQGTWTNHVDLGLWADLFVVAPASANTLSAMVTGHCDNFFQAVFLSCKCPVMAAPAMDLDMFAHAATQDNLATLVARGVAIVEPGTGALASGLEGKGRMAEPEEIADAVETQLFGASPLRGKCVLLTLGPTHEPVDAVRYLGNRSSGKMGRALVHSLLARGAEVHVVAGPVGFGPIDGVASWTAVETAMEMFEAAGPRFAQMDVGIAAAAVSDMRPANAVTGKLHRAALPEVLDLVPNPDILKHWGTIKQPHQRLIGFALEDADGMESATRKLHNKNLDCIVLNQLSDDGAGFQTDTNKVVLLTKGGNVRKFGLKSKADVAEDIVNHLMTLLPHD